MFSFAPVYRAKAALGRSPNLPSGHGKPASELRGDCRCPRERSILKWRPMTCQSGAVREWRLSTVPVASRQEAFDPASNQSRMPGSEFHECVGTPFRTTALIKETTVMECGPGMMLWGMTLFGLLGAVALLLLIAALVKYLFFSRPRP